MASDLPIKFSNVRDGFKILDSCITSFWIPSVLNVKTLTRNESLHILRPKLNKVPNVMGTYFGKILTVTKQP